MLSLNKDPYKSKSSTFPLSLITFPSTFAINVIKSGTLYQIIVSLLCNNLISKKKNHAEA